MYPWIPPKIHQQFIVCKHLLWPVILGFDFSYDYLIRIDWYSTNQLHLYQGPKSIKVSDLSPFPLHFNQISTLPSLHILVKTISQVTMPLKMLAISLAPATFNNIPQPDCYYNFIEMSAPYKSQQNIFVVPALKSFAQNYQYTSCVQL